MFSEAFPSHAKLWHVSSLPLPKQGYLEHHIPDSLCSSISPSFISSSMNQERWTHSIQQSAVLVCHQMLNFRVIIRVVQWHLHKLRSINYLFLSTRRNRMFMHQGIIWHETPAIFLTKSHFYREILEVKG